MAVTFQTAVNDLMQTATGIRPVDFDTLRTLSGRVVQAGVTVDPAVRSKAIGQMVDVILAAPPLRAAMVALACGALVEQGAHPYLAVHAIVTRLGGILGDASEFAQACMDQAAADDFDGDPIARYGDAVAGTMSEQATAFSALEVMTRPAIAMIARSARARNATRDEGRLLSRARRFPLEHGMLDWLMRLLTVLDDELLWVLHPGLGRGWQVEISGIVGNHQLFVLLEDSLIGEGSLPGERPPPHVVAAARRTQPGPIYRFQYRAVGPAGLLPDSTLSQDPALTISVTQDPADIPRYDNGRLLLLADQPDGPTARINAPYAGLEADLRVVAALSPAEVKETLEAIHNLNDG
jgi:hypothetical protein